MEKKTFDREAAVHRCIDLVWETARRIAERVPTSLQMEELVQAGLVGLDTASMRFDPEGSISFDAFAARSIHRAISDEMREHDAPRLASAIPPKPMNHRAPS